MAAERGPQVTAVVPLKALATAKSRLAQDLDDRLRRGLAAWMCARVLDACRAAPSVTETLVVAGDRDAAAVASALATPVLLVEEPGLSVALDAADTALGGRPATLVVAADLPLAQGDDLERVCRAGTRAGSVVVAPTVDGGTGALLRRPARAIRTAYGPGSADAHLRRARAAGLAVTRLDLPRLALDVDTPEALEEASRRSEDVHRWRVRAHLGGGRVPYDRPYDRTG